MKKKQKMPSEEQIKKNIKDSSVVIGKLKDENLNLREEIGYLKVCALFYFDFINIILIYINI